MDAINRPVPGRRPLAAVQAAVLAATVTACSIARDAPGTSQPAPSPVTPTESIDTMTTSPATDGTRITIEIDGETVGGTLSGNAAATALIDQLPLTLAFTDYGGQEKIADLPAPLSLEGLPAGSDADPLTIGYYAPRQSLVLYYGHVGYFDGIIRLGTFDHLAAVRDHGTGFTARLQLVH
ncbi:cyclophilin-like fold protein [Arthrobacter sp. UYEF36]|uniref:cyclophilin-like fold protein n=1 Tax=Arthrobacter sp. UYEF36 TaxID=1756366 RepID=UPI003397A2DF